ncbi:MAG: DNA adenine methylase [Rufibacter sp.]
MTPVDVPVPAKAKPFLKWAGGKTQLLPYIEQALPALMTSGKPFTYVEPFLGSGAVLFWFLRTFPHLQKALVNDINPDLYQAYQVVRQEPENLIKVLSALEATYFALPAEEARKAFFLEKRAQFNTRTLDSLQNTALLIFLNRTCFNGLYRVNSKGQFNVPFGKYANPRICDAPTLLADSQLLQKVTILQGDYAATLDHVAGEKAFFYFDPPYKPLSKTASFNAYAAETFNDAEQVRLKDFCTLLDQQGHPWLLSNSDVRNTNAQDDYFDVLYRGFDIQRVKAKRSINSVASKRGEIYELLVSNYEKPRIGE